MKVKLIVPDEIEIGKDFTSRIVEVLDNEPVGDLLLQAYGEPEVFVVDNGEKCWIQNWETARDKGYDLSTRQTRALTKLNEYETGQTKNTIGEPERARDIYYPEPEKPYPFKGLRGLLTLNPKPTKQQIIDLGFNAMMPYSGSVDWNGDYISINMGRPGKVILRYTGDELDCHKRSPQEEIAEYKAKKLETPDIPIGFNLNCSIGCGLEGTSNTVEEYRKAWFGIINNVDYVMLNCYPYRTRWPNAVDAMERFWKEWQNWGITIPIIPVIQAHWGYSDTIEPDPMEQVKFWFNKGLTGYVVYCWADAFHGVRDRQQEWKTVNEWAKRETDKV